MPGVLKTLDVSDGHSLASFEGSGSEGQNDCPKRHKLLLLDSLLQEVCINSGFVVSLNFFFSGLKKAHSTLKSKEEHLLKSCLAGIILPSPSSLCQ